MRRGVPSLASLIGLGIRCCCELGVGCRHSLDPELLWLWCRPAATAPIRPLAWELPFANDVALKSKKSSIHTVIPMGTIRNIVKRNEQKSQFFKLMDPEFPHQKKRLVAPATGGPGGRGRWQIASHPRTLLRLC